RRRGALAAVHPQQQAQGPHVAAEVRLARAEAEGLHGIGRELGNVELEELVRRERVVVQRIGLIARLGEVALVERRGVHDDGAAIRRSFTSTLSAAGFIATSTSTASPGVMTSTAPKWI